MSVSFRILVPIKGYVFYADIHAPQTLLLTLAFGGEFIVVAFELEHPLLALRLEYVDSTLDRFELFILVQKLGLKLRNSSVACKQCFCHCVRDSILYGDCYSAVYAVFLL